MNKKLKDLKMINGKAADPEDLADMVKIGPDDPILNPDMEKEININPKGD